MSDEDDEGENKVRFTATVLKVSDETMNEPSNLQIAQLIMIMNESNLAVTNLMLLHQNLLAEDGEVENALEALDGASESLSNWWLDLLKNPIDEITGRVIVQQDDEEEDDDDE